MNMRQFFILFLIFAIVPNIAWASNLNDVKTALKLGHYDEAYNLAEAMNTTEGYVLASEALARQVMLGKTDKLKKKSKKARTLALKALELDPNHQNARLQYAVADGFVARLTGDVSAWMKKLPQKSLAHIESYRAIYPDDPRGDALLGAWHLGVVRKAGNVNGNKWFGASIEEGQRFYENALLKTPEDPVIVVNYALGLMALDETDFKEWSRPKELLVMIGDMPSGNDLSDTIIQKGQRILSVIDQRELAHGYAKAFLDGEGF